MNVHRSVVTIFLLLSVMTGHAQTGDRCGAIRIDGEKIILHEVTDGPAINDLNSIRAGSGFSDEIILCGGFPAKYGWARTPQLSRFGVTAILISNEILKAFTGDARKGVIAHEFSHIYLGHHKTPVPDEKTQELEEILADESAVRFVGKPAMLAAVELSVRMSNLIPGIDRREMLYRAHQRMMRIKRLKEN